MFAPHLPWRGRAGPRAGSTERWSAPVVLDNDANCAARAEATYGAARGARHAIVVTLGTGIGGARRPRRPRAPRAATAWPASSATCRWCPDGRPCECGGRGCWEQYCSGNALVRFARARRDRPTMLEELCGGNPQLLTGPMVTEAAEAGDLRRARRRSPRSATGSASGWPTWSRPSTPTVVVIGGGVSAAGDLLLEPARGRAAASRWSAPATASCRPLLRRRARARGRRWSAPPTWRRGSGSGASVGRARARPRAARGTARRR